MHRHIKFLAKLSATIGYVDVIIVEQTHICEEFIPADAPRFRINGIILDSCDGPAYYHYETPEVYLRGKHTRSDHNVIRIPEKNYPKFRAAVEEYNSMYGEAKPTYKHIKIGATPIGNGNYSVTIIEQTSYLADFANVIVYNGSAFHPEHSAVVLCSHDAESKFSEYVGPQSAGKGFIGTVYVKQTRGSRAEFTVSAHILDHLITAVEEYNEYYSGK